MKFPTCSCLYRAYLNKFTNNPQYGMPKKILVDPKDRVVVKCAGDNGTVRLRNNFCCQCGKPILEKGVYK